MKFFGSKAPKIRWQTLSSDQKKIASLYRSPVPGGWLISSGEDGGVTFIPDAEHQWDGYSLENILPK
ncbi:hypothetical protein L0B52_02525 [Suttonella sp. R2A3]|uniref:hypothetical protein n=1 Tax=Suttonella sp. R2A3 TaxID=2908648 RepID=UPI001F3AE5C3|nr:hypothetical protein [Suttonella sp. R2A3]UJF25036.1 hypothetical protein L0B52_02525 [Suttonella sp. R2A3]